MNRTHACAGWILSLCLACSVFAQQPAPAVDRPGGDDDPSVREQTIYVPYSRLQKVFEQQGRGVYLPYEEFQKLWKQARAAMATPPDDAPPVDALITEISSEATVQEDVVRVTADLKIEVLAEGWHEIPLRLNGAAILSAERDGQPARVMFKPEGGYWLLVQKTEPGPQQLSVTVEYTKAFTKTPGQNVVSFQAPQAPINQWRIRVPQAGVKVNIQPLVAATEEPDENGAGGDGPDGETEETVVLAFVGAAPQVQIDWTPKAEGAMGLEALATVQTEQQVTIDEGVIRTRAQLNYTISRAELSELVIEAPSDHKVLNAMDANVREWTVEEADGVNRITVQLYEPARSTQQIIVEMEKFSEEMLQNAITAPVVQAVGVGRQQGVLVVRVASSLRAETDTRTGLLQLDSDELPPGLASGQWDFSYRFPLLPFALSLNVEKVQPQIRTRELVEAYLEPERLTLDLLALYDIQRAGVFQLELDVPAGFEIRSVRGHAAAGHQAVSVDSHHLSGQEQTRLVVNLASKAIGNVGLFVELQRRLEEPNLLIPTGQTSEIALPLPRVAPTGVEQSTGRLLIYTPESLRVNPAVEDGVQVISFAEALEGAESTRSGRFGVARQVLAYTYTRGDVDLLLNVERRKPYITARQVLLARVESGVIKYEATLFYDIRYSGVKALRLDVPASLADKIRNQTPNVAREAVLDPQPDDVEEGSIDQGEADQGEADQGYVAWSLTGETEFLGEIQMKFAWETKLGELVVGTSAEQQLPRLQPKDVDRAWGQIVIAKAETLDVRPAGEPVGLRPIDPQHDLMAGVQIDDAARGFEFYDDWKLNVAITRYELVEVKRTSIERAVIRMEVTRSDVISVQALYRMRSARQRLRIVLPADVEFDTDPLRINGRSVSLERGEQEEYFVPLAGRNTEKPFLLEVRYTTPGDQSSLDLPVFPSDPAVQKVYLCAYVPQELAVWKTGGPWTDEMSWRWYELFNQSPRPRQSDDQLVAWVIDGLDVPDPMEDFATDGHPFTFSTLQPAPPPKGALRLATVRRNVLNGLIFVPILIIGLLVLRQPVPRKLAAVMLVVTLLLVVGLFAPILARQLTGGALLSGLLVVAAAWIVWHVAQAWSTLAAARASRRVAREQQAASGQAAGADSTSESAPTDAASSDGDTPFAADSSDAAQTVEGVVLPESDDDQEGGRNDA